MADDYSDEEPVTLVLRPSGALMVDGIVVGDFAPESATTGPARLTLQAGWLRNAGVRLVVVGEPGRDKRTRTGTLLDLAP